MLAIVKARLAIDDGFRSLGLNIPQWIMEQDRRSDAKPDEPPSQQRLLYHWFRSGDKTFSCQPDAACQMSIPRDAAAGHRRMIDLIAFFEIDRSTERRNQFLGKYPGYTALIEQRGWLRYFPSAASAPVRILVVCQSRQRLQSLQECSISHPLAPILRFTTATELCSAHPLTSPIWQDTTSQRREFIRLPVTTSSALS